MSQICKESILTSILITTCILMTSTVSANEKFKGNLLQQKITQMQNANVELKEVSLFNKQPHAQKIIKEFKGLSGNKENSFNTDNEKNITKNVTETAEYLTINKAGLRAFKKKAPIGATMIIPFKHQTDKGVENLVKVALFKRNIYTNDAKFILQDKTTGAMTEYNQEQLDLGVHYQGVVEGEEQSIVAISVYDNAIEGRIHSATLGDLNIGKLRDKKNRLSSLNKNLLDSHVVYRITNIDDKKPKHNCKMDGHSVDNYLSHLQTGKNGKVITPSFDSQAFLSAMGEKSTASALYDYYFTNYTVISGYLASEIGSAYISNWIGSVLNQVSAVYNVDGLLFYSEGWKSYANSPVYDGQEGAYLLEQFAYYDKANVENSDVGMLLTSAKSSASANYGLAYKIGGVCSYEIVDGLAYSPMNVAYEYFPTYSWTVDVYAHEAGHTLGSPHTHSCSWNGNNTAIDSCSGFTEGSCPLPGNPAWGQGTVMSYCSGSVGKNPALGFAPQPAAKIASHIWYCADR